MKARDFKIGDTFKKYGYKYTVCKIVPDEYKNGIACLRFECTMNDSKIIDSFFTFKLETKIK